MKTHLSAFLKRRPLHAAFLLLFAFLPLPLAAQGANYTVLYSGFISEGQYRGDYDIFGAGFSSQGLLENTADAPRAISSLNSRELRPVAVPDMEGGYFLTYTVEHADAAHLGDRDIVMRHVGHDGGNLWGDSVNHVVVVAQSKYVEQNPMVTTLSDGTLLVCYEVRYDTTLHGDVDVVAVRIARDGHMMWAKGTWVANSSKRREVLRGLISDGNGGALALIEAGTYRDSMLIGSDILAQRIDTSSRTGWKDSPDPVIVAASPYLESNPSMVTDRDGGAYIAYQLEYNKGDRAGDIDILAQHLTRYGTRAWTDEKNPPIVSSNAKAREQNPYVAGDSSGMVVAFEMSFVPTKAKNVVHVIGVQHLDSLGRPTWNQGKKAKLIAIQRAAVTRPQLLPDIAGGTFLVFESRDTTSDNRDIYAQRIAADGDPIWGDGERPTPIFNSPEIETDATVAADETGGIIVVARRYAPNDTTGRNAVIAQRLNVEGNVVWTDFTGPLPVVNNAFGMSAPVLVRR